MLPDDTASSFPSNSKILIVEDNRINQAVLLGILSNLGLSADIASNGKEALECLLSAQGESAYQLLIMDCQMPEMDGYQATKAIRSAKAGLHYIDVPIIAMTANAMKGDKEKCLDSGMNDYLTKPIDIKRLTESMTRWLHPKTNNLNISKEESKAASSHLKPNVQIESIGNRADNEDQLSRHSHQQPQKSNALKSDKPIEKARLTWDQDGFMKRISHNEVIGKKLLILFMDEVPADIELLQQAIVHEYSNDIIALAHKIKGSSRNLGADDLADVCSEIEQMAKKKEQVKWTSLREKLTSNFNQFIMKIEKHVN